MIRAAAVIAFFVTASIAQASPTPYAVAHYAVHTDRADAQREFDEALTLLDSFNPQEAIRRFASAARRDPSLAMAQWGIALAYGPDINTEYSLARAANARDALARAHRLEGGASDVERALIAALDQRYAAHGQAEVEGAQRRYATAMGDVVKRFPGDLEAATLYAESLMDLQPWNTWSTDGKPAGETPRVLEILRGILERDPGAIQANHLFIHAIEASPHPEEGLASARRLAALRLEPGAEHLVHMPAHIFDRTGDYEDAIRASNDAIAHFREYLRRAHAAGHEGYLWHDAGVLVTAQMSAGSFRAALATARRDPLVGDDVAALRVMERFHEWRALLSSGTSNAYGRALAYAATGEPDRAAALVTKIDASDDKGKLSRTLVRAEILCARGHVADALPLFEEAVTQQDALGYGEPPEWYFPVRETLAARLMQTGRAHDAQRVAAAELRRDPGNPRALFLAARALDAIGAPEADRKAASQAFHTAWANADRPLVIEDLY